VNAPLWVLDTGALMAFAHGVDTVGHVLADAADVDGTVAAPLLCVVEAYSLVDHKHHDMLRMLRRNPVVRTAPATFDVDDGDDCPTIGGLAKQVGRLGAGHAAYTALVNAAGVVTSRADQISALLGADWPVVEV
jgi:hypothetical protein